MMNCFPPKCHKKLSNENIKNTYFDMLEIDIVSESVRPELKLASSESRRETGL